MTHTDPQLLAHAKDLRKNQTPAERLLWGRLRGRRFKGLRWRRQVVMKRFILDFYCPELHLAVELDGGQHGGEEMALRDGRRTRKLEEVGVTIVRYWNHEVTADLAGVLEALWGVVVAVREDKERRLQ